MKDQPVKLFLKDFEVLSCGVFFNAEIKKTPRLDFTEEADGQNKVTL